MKGEKTKSLFSHRRAKSMIHAKMVKPHSFSWNSARAPEQIDRLQDVSGDLTLNRDKLYEIGRVDLLGFRKRTPSLAGKFRQFEKRPSGRFYDSVVFTEKFEGFQRVRDCLFFFY